MNDPTDSPISQDGVDDMLKKPPFKATVISKPPDPRCPVCNLIAPCGKEHPGPYNPGQVDELERDLYALVMDDRIEQMGFEGRYVCRSLIATIRTLQAEAQNADEAILLANDYADSLEARVAELEERLRVGQDMLNRAQEREEG